jgi:hypothetical protein
MKTPVRKPDGEMRPRIETWENVASHLRRFISPQLGKKIASEVTTHDIATLSNDIVSGKHGGKPSVANARHMRRAASGLFNWAAEAGRDYVTASPCISLPPWLTDPLPGYVTPLSQNASVYDYIADDGHRNIGSWIDKAAQGAGR